MMNESIEDAFIIQQNAKDFKTRLPNFPQFFWKVRFPIIAIWKK